jgi:cyclophilin family peptidyl-prolyl cis-trans isomerase
MVRSVAISFGAAALACHHDAATGHSPASSPSASIRTSALSDPSERAEATRDVTLLSPDAERTRDVAVRRAAARALARIADGRAVVLLPRALADEDAEVVAWGAYGLGFSAEGRESDVVPALVARAASLTDAPFTETKQRFSVAAEDALADALARTATLPAERTLRAWLDGPADRAASSAFALGRLAAHRRLEDSTIVRLLERALGPDPLPGVLAAFARTSGLGEPGKKRLVEAARAAIAASGERRILGLRALAAGGPDAVSLLQSVLTDDHATATDRAIAATTLGRLGPEGQTALASALAAVSGSIGAPDGAWLAPRFAPLSALLAALESPGAAVDPLRKLAELPVANDAAVPVKRRFVALRCAAAAILAGRASRSVALVACDRGSLDGARFTSWKKLAQRGAPAVRRAALALATKHAELPPIHDVLIDALGASAPGVVAAAARVLAESPERANSAAPAADDAPTKRAEESHSPSRLVVEALSRAMDRDRPPDEVETRVQLMRAAAALGALSLKARVETLCKDPNATIRRHAEAALRALGSTGATCSSRAAVAPSDGDAPAALVTLTFVMDSGRFALTLDPSLAPFAAARLVALSRAGFYDGVVVHRVVPGFVVQFGDRGGDGYGGAGKVPLPSETSPLEFHAFAVGLAESGRDTGSSQMFVTLSPEPELYGNYPLLGFADPDWANVAEGDVILRVEIR